MNSRFLPRESFVIQGAAQRAIHSGRRNLELIRTPVENSVDFLGLIQWLVQSMRHADAVFDSDIEPVRGNCKVDEDAQFLRLTDVVDLDVDHFVAQWSDDRSDQV